MQDEAVRSGSMMEAVKSAWGRRKWLAVVVFAVPVAWKCVGMMVACYAPGYWWAARRPLPEIVAVGLLGKGPRPDRVRVGHGHRAAAAPVRARDPHERCRVVACVRRLPQALRGSKRLGGFDHSCP